MKGLRKTCSETKNLKGYYSGEYLEIFYDKETKEVWGIYHYSLGQNEWTVYHEENIIKICTTSEPMTTREIKEKIEEKLNEMN